MKVVVDDKSGFCPGVVKAIEMAEAELASSGKVYSLGDIMHNKVEMNRLKSLGLHTIKHSEIESIESNVLFIRAHGEPPTTYARCKAQNHRVVDATCKVVARLQKIVEAAYIEMSKIGGQVVILGKHGHPEVIGLEGQVTDGSGIVVDSLQEITDNIDFNRPIYFLSQTTKSLTLFNDARELISERYKDKPPYFCTIKDTICRQVSNRQPHLQEFSAQHDIIIFVAGADSSNGKALYATCNSVNKKCYKIEDASQLDSSWFKDCKSVGICGATSTPRWLMDNVANAISSCSLQ